MQYFAYIKYARSTISQRHNITDGANVVYFKTHWQFILVKLPDYQRAGTPLLQGKAESCSVQRRDLVTTFQYLNG